MLNNNKKIDYQIFIIILFVNTAIDYRCQSLKAWWADKIVLAVTATKLPVYIIT